MSARRRAASCGGQMRTNPSVPFRVYLRGKKREDEPRAIHPYARVGLRIMASSETLTTSRVWGEIRWLSNPRVSV
jgi:hypothetical protein